MRRDHSESSTASAPDRGPDLPPRPPVAAEPWDAPEWPVDDDRGGPEAARGEQARRRHREVLGCALIVLVLAFALVEVPDGRVAVRGLTPHPLPPSCVSRSLLGVRCPGCGLTRSIIRLAEGDWRGSWRCHRLGGLLAAVLIFQIPYRLLALHRPGYLLIPPRWRAGLGLVLIALLIVNWLADVVTGRLSSL